jgi:hypothetical protein
MKDIKAFCADKYNTSAYSDMGNDIYKGPKGYVISLSFQQEPEAGEGCTGADISQYPLEDILEKFLVHVSDFYPELNTVTSTVCVLEFCSPDIQHLVALRGLIGKHVFNKTIIENEQRYVQLMIE